MLELKGASSGGTWNGGTLITPLSHEVTRLEQGLGQRKARLPG